MAATMMKFDASCAAADWGATSDANVKPLGMIGAPPGLEMARNKLAQVRQMNGDMTRDGDVKNSMKLHLDLDTVSTASTVSEGHASPSLNCDGGEYSPRASSRASSCTPRYHRPDQTIIIFDWDDTLCPTTVCSQPRSGDGGLISDLEREELAPVLSELAREASALFARASEFADKVVVVTNAGEGWVEWSCAEWLPGLLPALKHVEVISARSIWEPQGYASPTCWKERTFRDVIDRFYSQYEQDIWKNIVCIGDAPYEHEALSRVTSLEEHSTRCRSKSVKFMAQPTVERLSSELRMLRANLEEIVSHDDDMYMYYLADSL
jgi:hypothetical protein